MKTARYFVNIFSISPKFSGYSKDRISVLSILLLFVLVTGGLWEQTARGDDVLILEATVTSPAVNSLEYQTAIGLGFGVDVVDNTAWAALTAAQFASYRAIILGDRHCTGVSAVTAAVANNSTWGPEVDGNIVLIGTDPVFHQAQGGQALTEKAMAFATDEVGKTGAYITLSCYYSAAPANTAVPLLDYLSNFGGFTVTSVGCFNNAHIVAVHPALVGLVDGDLSNWSCSVHEAFDSWPGDFMVLAIAHNNSGIYTADDGTVGTPYILARGEGLEPVSSPGIKWQQLPDETRNGMDIRMDRDAAAPRILADDFFCTQTGFITDVRFWGSWQGDAKSSLTRIHLSIHGDIPADPCDPDSYSKPGTLYWSADFFPGDFTETLYRDLTSQGLYEWWWDPYILPPNPNPMGDQKIWEYYIPIDPNIAFLQEGTPSDPLIYWLDIYVETDNSMGFDAYFGWKTARTHWNDDAVYRDLSGVWQELRYPNPHPFEPNSIDLAFEIGTQSLHEPELEACCFPEDGSCLDLPPAQCVDDGGIPQGSGTDCIGVDCSLPDPNEACCLPDGSCIDTTVGDCLKKGGTPQGTGTLCTGADIDCIIPCMPEPNDCPNGDPPLLMSINIGSHDNFAPGPDPGAAPDAILLTYITGCSAPGVPLQLDEIPGEAGVPANSWFGHTFDALPLTITGATLEFRARATTGGGSTGTFNDHIAFVDTISGCSPTWSWQNRFENLPEAMGTWDPGQVTTFCLDLDALPIGNTAATTSVISQLASGSLSIRVDDDTGIDYVLLTIAVCSCEYPARMEIAVEVPDGFMAPDSAPAAPSPELITAFGTGFRGFDQILSNRRFGHTFTNLPPNILAAELEIGLRAGTDIPTNDSLSLEFLNPTFRWGKRIKDLPIIPPGSGAPIGAWSVGTSQVFILDLADLPPSTASVTSVLAEMADGDLDVYIQDDTAVNYMILRLEICCDDAIPGDSDHDGDVDLVDLVITAVHWLWGKP